MAKGQTRYSPRTTAVPYVDSGGGQPPVTVHKQPRLRVLCPARPLSRVDGRDAAHTQREPPRVASLRGRGALPRTNGVARSRLRVLFRQQPAAGALDQRPGVRRTHRGGSRVSHALVVRTTRPPDG